MMVSREMEALVNQLRMGNAAATEVTLEASMSPLF